MPKTLASFCRLCLTKTSSKVPVFGGEQENVTNLLALIELSINPEIESDAVVCFDCVVTLETFLQFKDQCHVNDEFLKTLPPKDSAEDSEASEEDENEVGMECDLLEVDDDDDGGGTESQDSEEQRPVQDVAPPRRSKQTVSVTSPRKETRKAKQLKAVKVPSKKMVEDPLSFKRSSRAQRAKPVSRLKRKSTAPNTADIAEFPGPQPTEDDLPKLQDSYPDYFHFERGSRSLYYDLVYYGERFNSAVYGASYTYWQCAHRSKFKCPALVHVSNDYTEFERRFEHTHGDQRPKGKPELLTPKQALPTLFRICWHKVNEKKSKRQQVQELKKELKKGEKQELEESHEEETLRPELNQSGNQANDDESDEDVDYF